MGKIKQRILAALSILVGMAVVLTIGFWSLRANAFVRPALSEESLNGALREVAPTNAVAFGTPSGTNGAIAVVAAGGKASNTVAQVTVAAKPVEDPVGILNRARQYALGMIETANDDREIGRLGEISRFQIMPSVWSRYSKSRQYENPAVSVDVARQHWLALYRAFKSKTGREPSDFDMYVLWNTRFGYYASRNWQPAHLGTVVRDRARRFANLVERGS